MTHNVVQGEMVREHTGGRRARSVRLLVAGTAMGMLALMMTGGGAVGAECPPGTNPFVGCGGGTAPWWGPSSPTPNTGAPILWLPPVKVPPVTVPPVTVPPVTVPPVAIPPVTVPPVLLPARSVPEAGRRLLDLANGERQRAGLASLTARDDVTAIALAHSQRMAAAGDIFHNDGYFGTATRNLLNSAARGENVAQNTSVDDAHARLMNSPGHRANLLDRRFSVVGFAVVQGSDGRYFVTQDFLLPAGAPPRAAVAGPVAGGAAKAVAVRTAPPSVARPARAPTPEVPEAAPPAVAVSEPAPSVPVTVLASSSPIAPTQPDGELSPPLSAVALVLLGAAVGACWFVPRRLRWS